MNPRPDRGGQSLGGLMTKAKKNAPHRSRWKSKPKFLAVDFFCGAGGTARGLIDAGGYVIAGVDKDPRCDRTFSENNPNNFLDYSLPRYLCFDIFERREDYPRGQQKELLEELRSLIEYYRDGQPEIPLLFSICAPCQPFTRLSKKALTKKRQAGRKKDTGLLKEAVKFVKRFKPELILSENVSGIQSPSYGGIWDDFQTDLEALRYVTGTKLVCTSRFGVPQYRKRSILLAVQRKHLSKNRLADLMGPELLVPEADPDALMVSVREAIDHLPPIEAGETHLTIPNHRARSLSDLNKTRLKVALPGQSNAYMENTEFGDLSLDCHRKVNERLNDRCFSDVYTRMHPDRPSPTITTKCHSISSGRFGHYDTSQLRGLSLREAAILQSFPEDYIFYPTDQIEPIARMVGNAVPPKLAAFFASYLVGG